MVAVIAPVTLITNINWKHVSSLTKKSLTLLAIRINLPPKPILMTIALPAMTIWHMNTQTATKKAYTRLAYLTWQPDPDTEIKTGKFAVWLAGGFLGDDYVKGVVLDHTTKNKVQFSLLASRYEANANWPGMVVIADGKGGYNLKRNTTDRNIWYAKAATTFGKTDVGLHYLAANNSFVSANDKTYDDTKIYALTIGSRWQNIDWSAAYGENTQADESDSMFKLQASKTVGKSDFILQYWYQGKNMNLPLENGNHMAFWTDQYSNQGLRGYRAIFVYHFTENLMLETFYGDYRSLDTRSSGSKYGFATTVQF